MWYPIFLLSIIPLENGENGSTSFFRTLLILEKSWIEFALNSNALSEINILGYPNLSKILIKQEITASELRLRNALAEWP